MKRITIFIHLIILFFLPEYVNCQIEFYDYSPDTVITVYENFTTDSAFFLMDINGDSIDDIEFKLFYKYNFLTPSCTWGFSVSVISINGKNKFSGTMTGYPCDLTPYSLGDTIDNNNNWDPDSDYLLFDYCGWPSCNKFGNAYLAFTDTINNNCYFGWILLSTHSYGGDIGEYGFVRLTVKEYAYNKDPNHGMIAGDTISSIVPLYINNPLIQDKPLFFPNPTKGKIYINDIGFEKIEILNFMGDILIETKTNEINMKEYSNGIYFIRYYIDGIAITRKIIKK